MDKSGEEEGPVMVNVVDLTIKPRDCTRVRRRLVQSTLIPHKSPPTTESKEELKVDKICNGDSKDAEDGEFCGSQGRKKGTRKRKESPQTKTPKPPKKAKGNSSVEATPEKDSTPKNSKVNGTPRKKYTPRKKATPIKNGASNGNNTSNQVEDGNVLQQIPNLRLEAKMKAEENSRLFAGKQIHPFFLSQRAGKRSVEKAIRRKPESNTMGPIHVFEKEQDDAMVLDWSCWKFCEKSFTNTDFIPEGSSSFECTVKSLCFDNVPSVLVDSSLLPDNTFSDHLSIQEFSHQASATVMSSDIQEECQQLVEDAKVDYQVDKDGLIFGCVIKSDGEEKANVHLQRMSSHLGSTSQLDNRLWTDKYKPQKAVEVCGNNDSVRFLNEWLSTWHKKGCHRSKTSIVNERFDNQDPDYNCYMNDSDSENISEEDSPKNILLITGPVGSGKSAAIYACAKEQGFKVLEANASECRNGATLKERFGELESQSTLDLKLLQWSQLSLVEFQSMDSMKSARIFENHQIAREPESKVVEVITIPDEDMSDEAYEASKKFAGGEQQLKPLILFEDVDVIFSEDRGFITAMEQIANKVKWPIILTSNSDTPVLPDSMDRFAVCFNLPLKEELLHHLHMVCSFEKTNAQPSIVEQLIEFCHRDIRKTLMHLQFWCQGEQFKKGTEAQTLSNLIPFNLEAGYQILPKMMPWNFPSQLSQLVEKEITMSLNMIGENSAFHATFDDIYDDKDGHNLEKPIYEEDCIEAKKKRILSRHCSNHDCIDFTPLFDTESNVFDSSSSLLLSSERNCRRKLMVLSSDSEDDDRVPTTPDITGNELFIEGDGGLPSHYPSMQKQLSPSTGPQHHFEDEKLIESNYQCLESVTELNVKDTCLSVDLSCVPESSFVPETEVNGGTESLFDRVPCDRVGQLAEIIEEASVSNEFWQNLLLVEANNFDESLPTLHKDSDLLGGTYDVIARLSPEEVEDSQDERGTITSEHQLMDKCSRMNLGMEFQQHEKRRPAPIHTVQETWRKLRDGCADLRHFVDAEKYSSGIVKLACGLSNLISEAELLHVKCHSTDYLGLPIALSEEPDAFSWYNEQLQMASTILQHGFCLYAKDIAAAGLSLGCNKADLAAELLSSPTKTKVCVKNGKALHVGLGAEMNLLENGISPNSEFKSILQSMVPARAYTTIKGDALYEYLSSLGHISRSEASRLSEAANNNKRRRGRRASRNYLSTGSLMLSPEEISLLAESSIYGKISQQD